MSLYSAIQFVTVSLLYREGSNLGDFQFLYIDLFLIIPIAVFMSWSKPYPKLCVKKSTANLISPKIIIPLLGSISIILAFQLGIYNYIKDSLAELPWYVAPTPGDDDAVKSTDNTLLFLYGNYQYILVALMLTVGPPYREPATSNHAFIITITTTTFMSTLLMFVNPDSGLGDLMDLTWASDWPKFVLVLAASVNYGILELGDKFLFLRVAKLYKRFFGKPGSKKKFKNLKREFKSLGTP
ncbi:unnamed protein product [Ambrosiozyma monospora]|uniref:Unnamed protein product n=1 Tax=Ambrosiozyma monospora TaxID=43982 RepID=A0ACB5T449_AMBMO|nr:unnamed protein product [Ambrosiozyma monospora]